MSGIRRDSILCFKWRACSPSCIHFFSSGTSEADRGGDEGGDGDHAIDIAIGVQGLRGGRNVLAAAVAAW